MPGKEEASFGLEAYTDNRTPHSIAGMLPAPHASNWRNDKHTSTSLRVLSFHYKIFSNRIFFTPHAFPMHHNTISTCLTTCTSLYSSELGLSSRLNLFSGL